MGCDSNKPSKTPDGAAAMLVRLFFPCFKGEEVKAEDDDALFASPDLELLLFTVETFTAPSPPSRFSSLYDMSEDPPAVLNASPAPAATDRPPMLIPG